MMFLSPTGAFTTSAAQKGLFTLGLSGFTYFPLKLATSSPSVAQDIISRQKARIRAKVESGALPKGQKEQYEIMLRKIETGKNGDCEVILFPGAMVPTGMYSSAQEL